MMTFPAKPLILSQGLTQGQVTAGSACTINSKGAAVKFDRLDAAGYDQSRRNGMQVLGNWRGRHAQIHAVTAVTRERD
jgi:hypothetical protein